MLVCVLGWSHSICLCAEKSRKDKRVDEMILLKVQIKVKRRFEQGMVDSFFEMGSNLAVGNSTSKFCRVLLAVPTRRAADG